MSQLDMELDRLRCRHSELLCYSSNPNYAILFFFTSLCVSAAQDYFQTFRIGVGGPCSFRFTPQASYWWCVGLFSLHSMF